MLRIGVFISIFIYSFMYSLIPIFHSHMFCFSIFHLFNASFVLFYDILYCTVLVDGCVKEDRSRGVEGDGYRKLY